MTGHMNITQELAHARRVDMIRRAERDRLIRMAEVAAEPKNSRPRRPGATGWVGCCLPGTPRRNPSECGLARIRALRRE